MGLRVRFGSPVQCVGDPHQAAPISSSETGLTPLGLEGGASARALGGLSQRFQVGVSAAGWALGSDPSLQPAQ